MVDMKRHIYRLIFLIGWLLSPFTLWNDVFVNIPLSYILANIYIKFFPADFAALVVVFYWLSNLLGVALMAVSGKPLVQDKKDLPREVFIFIITIIVYSVIVVMLSWLGVLRPVF